MSRCLESSASQNLLPMKARWYRNCKMRKLSSTFPFTYSRFFLLLFLPFEVALESSDLICSTFTIPCAPTKLKDDRVVKGLGTCTTKGKYVRESSRVTWFSQIMLPARYVMQNWSLINVYTNHFSILRTTRPHQPLKVTTMEAVYVVTLRGWWALVVHKIKKWFV